MGKDNLVGRVLNRTVKKIKKGLAVGTLSLAVAIVAPSVLDSVVSTSYDAYRTAKTALIQSSQSGAERGYAPNTRASLSYNRLSTIESQARGGTYNTTPGESVASIQTAINNPSNDTINWTSGAYTQPRNVGYDFVGNKNYTFADGVTISGYGSDESTSYIFKTFGSNINITGTGTVTLNNSKLIGIFGGGSFYNNIHVSGIKSEPIPSSLSGSFSFDYEWENRRKTDGNVEGPSVYFVDMTLLNGGTGFHFSSCNQDTDGTTPYISLENITSYASKILIDLPIRDDIPGPPYHFVDGQNYLNKISLLNSDCIVYETLRTSFNCPNHLAQKNVLYPYENQDEDCFVATDADFHPGTFYPKVGGRLDLGNEEYIGAYTPRIAGDADLNGYVDIPDLVALARNWNKENAIWEQGNFVNDSLTGSKKVDIQDLVYLARNWHQGVPPPGSSSVPEPTSLAMIVLGGAGLAYVNRRRKRAD